MIPVSVICPTTRDRNNALIQEIFEAQDYHNKEIIFNHNEGTIGQKRNACVSMAEGDIIVHFDSDDWYAPDYISKCVSFLQDSQADMTGLSKAYFYNPHTRLWLFEWQHSSPYIIGSGMCYWRKVWESQPFRNLQTEEDKYFQANRLVKAHPYTDLFMAMIHSNNTCSHLSTPYMQRQDPLLARSILGDWYSKY